MSLAAYASETNYPEGGTPYDGLYGKVYLFQAWGTWKAWAQLFER